MLALVRTTRLSTWESAKLPSALMEPLPDLEGIVDSIFRTYGELPANAVWGDTTPVNISSATLIKRFCPSSKAIFLVRDGRDVVASYQRNQLAFDHLPTFSSQVKFWVESMKTLQKWEGPKLIIYYEDLVQNPQSVLSKVYHFLGLDDQSGKWEQYAEHLSEPFFELDQHQNVRESPNVDSIGKWVTDLSAEQKAICQDKMGKLLQDHGYKVEA